MASPLVLGGSLLLNAAIEHSRNKNRPKMISPEDAKSMMVLSAGDMNNIRQQRVSDVGSMTAANQQNIKQAGAANRAPIGSVLSALSGANYQAGRSLGDLEPQLAQMKRNSVLDWLNYSNQSRSVDEKYHNNWYDTLGGTLGTATKELLYSSANKKEKPTLERLLSLLQSGILSKEQLGGLIGDSMQLLKKYNIDVGNLGLGDFGELQDLINSF